MPRFAANLTLLYAEYPVEERCARAAADGFRFVEFLFPYAWPVGLWQQWLAQAGQSLILHNCPPGDWEGGERGIAGLPGREAEFRLGLEQALTYAQALGVPQLNCLAGLHPVDCTEQRCWQTLENNLRHAAERCGEAGIRLNLEAINSRVDMPGFLLDTGEKVIELLDRLQSPMLRLQFDLYHLQIMSGDLGRRLRDWLPYIGHVQFADNPGRHEPGTGEIRFEYLFGLLDELGYAGWVSAEYRPSGTTRDSLGWFHG